MLTDALATGHWPVIIWSMVMRSVVQVGILVTGAASGAHMNPAVTVAQAVWGRSFLTADSITS